MYCISTLLFRHHHSFVLIVLNMICADVKLKKTLQKNLMDGSSIKSDTSALAYRAGSVLYILYFHLEQTIYRVEPVRLSDEGLC